MNLFIKRLLIFPLIAFLIFGQISSIPGVSGGNAGVPGGSSGQYQYNSAGSFAGDAGLTRTAIGQIKLQDPTPTTGVTQAVILDGAGQGSTNSLELRASNNGLQHYFSGGDYKFNNTISDVANKVGIYTSSAGIRLASDRPIGFSSTTAQFGTPDIGLARDAAGRLRISDGSTGLGQIMIASSTPASAAATCAAGTVVWDSSYVYVCIAANTWKRAAIATW